MIHTTHFGTLNDGRTVEAHQISNSHGASATIITWGGIVTSLRMPDRTGHIDDVVLGFERLESYLAGHPHFGAITGRVAGRIPGGKMKIGDIDYRLPLNDGTNHLHGGFTGLDKRLWQATPLPVSDSLRLRYLSPDGEEGYPGNLDITVTYTLTEANEFIIETEATSDQSTPLSLTHHSYFNLAGEGCGTIENHELQIDSNLAVELDEGLTPLGRTFHVEGRAADFRQTKRLGDAIPDLFQGHGDLYLIPRTSGETLARIAQVREPGSGRVMEVSTTETCLQLYTGSHSTDPITGKSGKTYGRFSGLCLECEGYPDAVNTPGFGDIFVRPGQPQRHTTVYAFSTY
jgi:aldose 1-epimerase